MTSHDPDTAVPGAESRAVGVATPVQDVDSDEMLSLFTRLAQSDLDMQMGITLYLGGGAVISGVLVGRNEWLDLWAAASERNATTPETVAIVVERMRKAFKTGPDEASRSPSTTPTSTSRRRSSSAEASSSRPGLTGSGGAGCPRSPDGASGSRATSESAVRQRFPRPRRPAGDPLRAGACLRRTIQALLSRLVLRGAHVVTTTEAPAVDCGLANPAAGWLRCGASLMGHEGAHVGGSVRWERDEKAHPEAVGPGAGLVAREQPGGRPGHRGHADAARPAL